jgi:5-formyltetrahydrofolate cyclo-ligase
MNTRIQEAKTALREKVRLRLKKMAPEERRAASNQACALLFGQPIWTGAGSILFFAPLPLELDVWPLLTEALAAGKRVALPRFQPEARTYAAFQLKDPETDLRVGKFGIQEPKEHCAMLPVNVVDLILVPGIAFDLHGRRLGRGKGYYDQLLALLAGPRCGVVFDQQIVPEIPVEAHDAKVNYLLTPTRWADFRG